MCWNLACLKRDFIDILSVSVNSILRSHYPPWNSKECLWKIMIGRWSFPFWDGFLCERFSAICSIWKSSFSQCETHGATQQLRSPVKRVQEVIKHFERTATAATSSSSAVPKVAAKKAASKKAAAKSEAASKKAAAKKTNARKAIPKVKSWEKY